MIALCGLKAAIASHWCQKESCDLALRPNSGDLASSVQYIAAAFLYVTRVKSPCPSKYCSLEKVRKKI